MKHLEKIIRITEFVTGIMYVFGAISICALFVLMFGDVSGRFLFNAPINGTTEVSQYLLVAIAFLSLGYAQLKGAHVRVDTLVSRFPEKLQTCLNIIVLLLAILFFVIMTRQIGLRAYHDWSEKILLPVTTLRLPMWWGSLVAAIGSALLVVSLLIQLARNIVKLVSSSKNGAGR